ncbi:nucleoside 2-deoxyribosyltransferase [Staphylococcus phage phiSNIID]|nr:nucleoside 2-deoxyribosyltransferase [Staphylococcus phage phiSNIID]
MVNKIKDKVIYMGGHILNEAMVDYRDKQHKEVDGIVGVTPYSPHKDKSINDKANAEQTKLAERILTNDFKAMQESDIFVFDVLNEGLGTIAELGILLGMKHQAQETIKQLKEQSELFKFNEIDELSETYDILQGQIEEQEYILKKPVLIYCSDIRQGHGKSYNDPDRAEFSTNQFVYGMVLELTNGEGFISWEEVINRLEKLGEQDG